MSYKDYIPFTGLIIFGNIENLVLSSEGVVAGVDHLTLAILSLIFVLIWFTIGTVGTKIAIEYEKHICFAGGLAILILGIQAMASAVYTII